MMVAGCLVLAAKLPTQHWLLPQQIEIARGDPQSGEEFRLVVFGQLQVLPRIERQAGEGGVQFPVILKISRRHRELRLARAAFKNTDQLFRVAIRQRFEQHAVDHAEQPCRSAGEKNTGTPRYKTGDSQDPPIQADDVEPWKLAQVELF